eukprot:COSAG06_NODE_2655_length_6487_cov_123.824515_8_plen_66_part_00
MLCPNYGSTVTAAEREAARDANDLGKLSHFRSDHEMDSLSVSQCTVHYYCGPSRPSIVLRYCAAT